MLRLDIPIVNPSRSRERFAADFQSLIGRPPRTFETRHRRKDGTEFPVEVTISIIMIRGIHLAIATVRDITERKHAEEEKANLQTQLAQAQKMESVGRLAGGVAHDFNNMLTVILGYVEMALHEAGSSLPLHARLVEIQKAAQRSADLTRQLLAFARRQTIVPKVLQLNDTVAGMLAMLQRLVGEDISLAWMPRSGLWRVRIDPSQIDQILANLCANARDAISGPGKLTIETEDVTFDEAYCADHRGFVSGEYVLLAVSDDGRGMDGEVLAHVFEPFYTTKGTGQGTGLGLATVFGIVKQNEGFINVYSEPGHGTTVKVYLPRFEGTPVETEAARPVATPRGRGETVLVVEDERTILDLGTEMLNQMGYTVLAANTPAEAIRLARAHPEEIHLLSTDVVMPEMNGRELAERIGELKPGIKCLFMSGYTANVIAHRGVLGEDVHFIQKPFTANSRATKVREAIDLG